MPLVMQLPLSRSALPSDMIWIVSQIIRLDEGSSNWIWI